MPWGWAAFTHKFKSNQRQHLKGYWYFTMYKLHNPVKQHIFMTLEGMYDRNFPNIRCSKAKSARGLIALYKRNGRYMNYAFTRIGSATVGSILGQPMEKGTYRFYIRNN